MNVIERTVDCLLGSTLVLGFQGEAERTQVVIDASAWIEEFGGGGLLRVRHNPFYGDIYVPTGQAVNDGVLTWTISASDTVSAGYGQGEVWYSVTDEDQVEHILASAVFTTRVIPSLATASSTIPSGLEDWLTEAEEVLEELGDVATQEELDTEVLRAKAAEAYLQEQIDQGGGGGGGAVSSVNGKTGAVVLGASDVGALPDDTTIPSKTSQLTNDSGFLTSVPVESVNSKTGAVTLSASDVGALSDDTTIPSKTSQLTNDSGFITSVPVSSVDGKTGAVTILPAGGSQGQVLKKSSSADYAVEWANESGGGAVDSVNGKTGVVVLDASDVGALPSSTSIPTKTSDLTNDSGYGTYTKPSGGIPKTDLASGVQSSLDKADSALQTAPVTSVNNQTGAVVLSIPSSASDVGAIPAPASPTSGQYLSWNGSAWVATSLPVYSGGVS